jgi:L-malate glycosyltransferase
VTEQEEVINAQPRVCIIIPSWSGDVERVMRSIEAQTYEDYSVEVIKGVGPAARARNLGARRTSSEILLFIDDDAYFGHSRVLEGLVALLDQEQDVAAVGTSKIVPEDASRLQKEIARQVPRMIYPVVPKAVDSNPPLNAYGFTAITTTCCAVRREAFLQVKGFDENLTTGPEDTDFFYRLRRQGWRILVAGNAWVYHDPPASIKDLLRKSFWYGVGHALEAKKHPGRKMQLIPLNRWYGKLAVVGALPALPFAFFIHYYFDPVRRLELGFRPLKTLSTYAVLCGYVVGWYRGKQKKAVTSYMGKKSAVDATEAQPEDQIVAKPMKVLYVDAYPKFGGGQQVLYFMASTVNRKLYDPIVAMPPNNPLKEQLQREGVRCVALDFVESNYTMPSLLRPITLLTTGASIVRVVTQIIRLARQEGVDFIHANSAVAGVHSIPAAALLGLPCVVHSHDFNTAQVTNRLLTSLMHYKRSAMIFVSRVLAIHYKPSEQSYPYSVIHNAVDSTVYHPDPNARSELLEELGLPHDSFLIGGVGRIERWKGFDLVIKAFARIAARHPHARLVIVGDVIFDRLKDYKLELSELARRLGVEDKVTFTGFRSDIPRVMAGIDLLVHCPIDREGFPMIMIEAMASARPIVTVPSGGTVEQVFDGVNGLLAPTGDVEAIAKSMSRMIEDPQMAKRMGEVGLLMFQKDLTVEKFASRIERFYDNVVRNAPARRKTKDEGQSTQDETSLITHRRAKANNLRTSSFGLRGKGASKECSLEN